MFLVVWTIDMMFCNDTSMHEIAFRSSVDDEFAMEAHMLEDSVRIPDIDFGQLRCRSDGPSATATPHGYM